MNIKSAVTSLFVLLFFCINSFAFDEKMHPTLDILTDKNQLLSCSLEKNKKIYFCRGSDQNFFVKNDSNEFILISADKNVELMRVGITSVKSKGVTLEANGINQNYDNIAYKDAYSEYMTKVFIPDAFFTSYSEADEKDIFLGDGSKEYQELLKKIVDKGNAFASNFAQAANANQVSLMLSDNSEANCNRLDQTDKNCKLFECKDSQGNQNLMILAGKENVGTLSTPIMFGMKDGKFIAHRDILEVKHPALKTPLLNNHAIKDLPNHPVNINRKQYLELTGSQLTDEVNNIIYIQDPLLKAFVNNNRKICRSKSSTIDSYDKATNNLLDKISKVELAELIMVLDSKELLSVFASYDFAKKNGCSHNGIFYDPKARLYLDRITNVLQKKPLNNQTITKEKAQELFTKASNMKDIAFKYAYDGCYARAHLMARRFETEGVRVDKAWIKGDLYVPGTDIQWNYHVAPLVYVEGKDGTIEKMVIDPSLFDRPVTLEEWDNKIAKKTHGKSVMTAFPYPENAATFERSALTISSSEAYTPFTNINMTEEEKMTAATQTMKEYITYQKE